MQERNGGPRLPAGQAEIYQKSREQWTQYDVATNPLLTLAVILLMRGLYALDGFEITWPEPARVQVLEPMAEGYPPSLKCGKIPERLLLVDDEELVCNTRFMDSVE